MIASNSTAVLVGRRWLMALALSEAIVSTGCATSTPPVNGSGQAAKATAAEQQADHWIGKNIHRVVEVYGQPTYWTANHEGTGGRYFYDNPNQPHFVFETVAGGMIVSATKVP
jgi:hypothetical protein